MECGGGLGEKSHRFHAESVFYSSDLWGDSAVNEDGGKGCVVRRIASFLSYFRAGWPPVSVQGAIEDRHGPELEASDPSLRSRTACTAFLAVVSCFDIWHAEVL